MHYHIVVGANYGDEGKGLMTDYLVRKHGIKRVVRFNGGCQAGHTVQLGDGHRHIFSNWGSGTLAGAETELSGDVIVNPYHALKEAETFKTYPNRINIPLYPITTTPFEIALNQAVEEMRGTTRHGSCGLGINETVTRHSAMIERGISHEIKTATALTWLMEKWVPERGHRLGLSEEKIREIVRNGPNYIDAFLDTWYEAFHGRHSVFKHTDLWKKEDIVYEGAQGLALDEFIGAFPYVTRSNTGIRNALKDIRARCAVTNDIPEISIYYMTRTYNTRHGAGPLLAEMPPEELTCGREFGVGRFVDPTNKPNTWQGSLRFGALDIYSMVDRVHQDIERNRDLLKGLNFKPQMVVTCMDQSDAVMAITGAFRKPALVATEEIPVIFEKVFNIKVSHSSYGPTASDVMDRYY